MLLDIIVSFAIALLSGLGVGSGGLLVIYLTLYAGTPQLQAQGVNLVFFLFSILAFASSCSIAYWTDLS